MIPKGAESIMDLLAQQGHQVYLVGGCVRDLLLGKRPQDWDLATSARPEEVLQLFGADARPTGLRHGTVTVRQEGMCFEVTTFRRDGPYVDGRHPEQVTFSSDLEEDLARRDFTINAMAMDAGGQVTDLFGGREDLRRGAIRCVGRPEARFDEDALRILRALRFASRLVFTIEAHTAQAIHSRADGLARIAAERIRAEMDQLLLGPGVADVLLAYPDVLGVVLPEILPCVGFDQRSKWHCYTVWEHIARSVALAPAEPVLRWTMLLHDLAKPLCFTEDERGGHFHGHQEKGARMAAEILRRLRFDSHSSRTIEKLVRLHDWRPLPQTREEVLRWLQKLGPEDFHLLMEVKRADLLAQNPQFHPMQEEIRQAEELADQLLAENACYEVAQLEVSGRDLLARGLAGPQIGQMLELLLQQVISGQLPNERETLLAQVEKRKR